MSWCDATRRWAIRLLVLAALGCNGGEVTLAGGSGPEAPARAGEPVPGATAESGPPARARSPTLGPKRPGVPRIVCLGDSLTAGYGLAREEAWPEVVASRLAEERLPVEVVNAGVSGDTSAGGLARLDALLELDPDLVVVALGGNDGLRGLPVGQLGSNLRRIVDRARARGAEVLLCGLRMPPNYGPAYSGAFAELYPRLAEELDVPFLPFLLEDVAGDPQLNQPDGIHPTAEGARVIADHVLKALRPLVEEAAAATAR